MQVETGVPVNIYLDNVEISGEIVYLGYEGTQHGHCYSDMPHPTIADNKTELGIPVLGCFSSFIYNLNSETTYYVTAYCRVGDIIVYGEEISFVSYSMDGPPGGVFPREDPCK